jgi:hypothetical protein
MRPTKSTTIRIRALFKPDDPESICVLRLIGIANDLDVLNRIARETAGQKDDLANAKRRYVLRMSTLQIEGDEFKQLVNDRVLWQMIEHCKRNPAFRHVEQDWNALKKLINKGPFRDIANVIRNGFSAHIGNDKGKINVGYALGLVDEHELMTLGFNAPGFRNTVTDRLFDRALMEESRAKYEESSVEKTVEMTINVSYDVQNAIFGLAQTLTAWLYSEAQGY